MAAKSTLYNIGFPANIFYDACDSCGDITFNHNLFINMQDALHTCYYDILKKYKLFTETEFRILELTYKYYKFVKTVSEELGISKSTISNTLHDLRYKINKIFYIIMKCKPYSLYTIKLLMTYNKNNNEQKPVNVITTLQTIDISYFHPFFDNPTMRIIMLHKINTVQDLSKYTAETIRSWKYMSDNTYSNIQKLMKICDVSFKEI